MIGEICGYREQTIYPIAVSVGCDEKMISIKLMYDLKKYAEIDGEFVLNRFRTAIIQLTDPHKKFMSEIHLLSESETETLATFNEYSKIYLEQTVIDLFEARVEEYSDSAAVIDRDIPSIIFSPFGGILSDRVNRRNIMIILDFITVAIIGFFVILLKSDNAII